VLIQLGGLGIISFNVILLAIPGYRLSLGRAGAIQGYYLDGVEYRPAKIVRSILAFTAAIEAAGTAALFALFTRRGVEAPAFNALFQSVSAFCNTGLSTLPRQFEPFQSDAPVLLCFALLITLGNLGFIVLHDLFLCLRCFCRARRARRRETRRLSYHSRVVLGMTALLLGGGTALLFLLERGRGSLAPGAALLDAFFQTVNTRSAGFDVTDQNALCGASQLLTILLMFSGGGPGSVAGGVKLTTVFVLGCLVLRAPDADGDIPVFRRRLSRETLHKATVYLLKAAALLLLVIFALFAACGGGASFVEVVFEAVSAFGTVGLSLGLTGRLAAPGKWILILGMFAGRVGLFALAFPRPRARALRYPEGALLLG